MSKPLSFHTTCIACDHSRLSELHSYMRVSLVKCENCKLVFCSGIPTANELEYYYSNYGLQQYLSPITVKRYHQWLDRFEAFRKTGNMLDVGCANGLFLIEAKKRGWNVYGSEYGEQQVQICMNKDIIMHQGPLVNNVFPGVEFDVITSIEVIEHINNPQHELNIIHLKLRTGGIFFCTTPNFNALSRFILKDKYNIISYPEHLAYYTPTSLSRLMKRKGFKRLFIETSGISITRFNQSTGRKAQKVVSSTSDDEILRNKIESRFYLRFAKGVLNFILNITGLGYSMKGAFIKN